MHGYSFHSKQVAQGPHFFNLRSMCECFGRAVHRHITFAEESGDVKWLIDEDAASFSYAFKDDLKVTTDLEKARQMHADDAPEEETASEGTTFPAGYLPPGLERTTKERGDQQEHERKEL